MSELALSCQCGTITGFVENVTQRSCTRLVCYCSACQAFANELDVADRVLNEHGGTEIIQVAPSRVTFTQGHEHISCLQFSEKGAFR